MGCTLFFIALTTTGHTVHAADFVGSQQCSSCHQDQYQAWQGSHHDMSMRHAKPDAVLGDFDNASLTFEGKDNRFFKKAEQYWVNIEGPDGLFHDYKISYTFGYTPLQQYMVEFDDGRVQLIPFAWDSRSKADGGQRWFHLYPEFTDNHQEFYWTNTGQNWNYMCADCHSTNVDKNFDLPSNTYDTKFSEINVGCEACHGPASDHIDWNKNPDPTIEHAGFDRNLLKPVTNWLHKTDRTTLAPEAINNTQQTLVCAQCHSRHTQISNDDHVQTNEFGDRYLLSLIGSQLYYPDGQVYEEDFVYGSFLQSKMHRNGVTCSNCHDPHSAELTLPKETVCLQCHQASTYADTKHHHHPDNSSGAQCVNCHMPETTYMQIDSRRDHGWHIPRPDFARTLGTPDTCLSCHKDKDSAWSEGVTQQWQPMAELKQEKHFAPAFAAIDQGYQEAANALSHIAQNAQNAPIIRASALARMSQVSNQNTLIAIARAVKHNDSLVRIGAISGAGAVEGRERWPLLAPLLNDTVLAVRAEAAIALTPMWQELSAAQQSQLQPALDDYLAIQTFNEDRGFAHTNKGNVFAHQGKFQQAEQAYRNSIELEPTFVGSYLHSAELYRLQNNNEAGIKILKQGIQANPDDGSLAYSLGLAYIRNKQPQLAAQSLKQATLKSPSNANYFYVYSLSVEAISLTEAESSLQTAYKISSNPQHLFALCDLQIRHHSSEAQHCIAQLKQFAPENVIQQLQQRLILK